MYTAMLKMDGDVQTVANVIFHLWHREWDPDINYAIRAMQSLRMGRSSCCTQFDQICQYVIARKQT